MPLKMKCLHGMFPQQGYFPEKLYYYVTMATIQVPVDSEHVVLAACVCITLQ